MRARRLVAAFALLALGAAWCQEREGAPQRLEIILEKQEGGAWKRVDPGLVFEQNDRVRFRIHPNFDGYLYVMNQSTSGRYTLLFPSDEAGRKNRIEAGKEYLVPATQGWFRITGPPGHEIVYWMVSPVELKSEPDYLPLPPPPKPGKVPPNITPRCDETVLRARGDCVDTSAGAKAVPENRKLPENLAAVPGAASRELMFMRQQGASVVAAPQALKGPVVFEFRLAHR